MFICTKNKKIFPANFQSLVNSFFFRNKYNRTTRHILISFVSYLSALPTPLSLISARTRHEPSVAPQHHRCDVDGVEPAFSHYLRSWNQWCTNAQLRSKNFMYISYVAIYDKSTIPTTFQLQIITLSNNRYLKKISENIC